MRKNNPKRLERRMSQQGLKEILERDSKASENQMSQGTGRM
jgi:hypothetical protein